MNTKAAALASAWIMATSAFCAWPFDVHAQQIIPTSTRENVLSQGVSIDTATTQNGNASRSKYGEYASAVVKDAKIDATGSGQAYAQRTRYSLEIIGGSHAGKTLETTVQAKDDKVHAQSGDHLIVFIQTGDDPSQPKIFLESYDRRFAVYCLISVLILIYVLFSGVYGLRILLSLGGTAAIGWLVLAPLYSRGWVPALAFGVASLLASALAAFSALGLAKRSVMAAVAGWLGACVVYATVALLSDWSRLNPVMDAATQNFFRDNPTLDPQAIVSLGASWFLAALAISLALQVVDGVARVKQLNPLWGFKEAFTAGLTLGRDHLGLLAPALFAGAMGFGLMAIVTRNQFDLPWLAYANTDEASNLIITVLAGALGMALALPAVCATAATYWSDTAKKLDPVRRAQSWRPDVQDESETG